MKKIFSVFLTILAITNLQGNNIKWSSPPTSISGVGINASDPQVAIDANGNAISLWVENNLVKSSSKTVSGSWTAEATVSATNASSPRLVVDQSGNASAIWLEGTIIKGATKTLSGSWSSSTALSSSTATSPCICVDSAGDVVAAWARGGNIESSVKLFNHAWNTHLTITSTGATLPSIAVGGTGSNTRVVVVWLSTSGSGTVVSSSSKLISGSWSTAVTISDTVHNSANPHVAVDSNENALAIWYEYDLTGVSYTNLVVESASSPASGTWTAPTALSLPGIRNPSSLCAKVAFDNFGNAIALWNTSFDDRTFNIESSIKPVNGEWSPVLDLVSSNLYAYSHELSVTSFGDVLSLYLFFNGQSLNIQSIESDINGFMNNSWSVPITISQGMENASPKIAASINGNVIHAAAVWMNNNGTNNSIVASTGSKTLVLPPSGLSVTQSSHNFGVFTEYYNTLNWTASTDPHAAGYLIFRNGLFIGQVGTGVTHFIDDNRVQSGSVVYGITAIDSLNTQSAAISVSYP